MATSLWVLVGTATAVGLVHTLLGPDHYVPFVAMARAGRWSTRKALVVTAFCGVGHVLGSVVIGLGGIAFGAAFFRFNLLEAYRANVAAWLMIAFGLVYMIYGLRRAHRNKPHTHWHVHADGTLHKHEHNHYADHAHVHDTSDQTADAQQPSTSITPWVLFIVFILGPCEPLIPLILYPAASQNWIGVVLVTLSFGLITICAMLMVVWLGIQRVSTPRLQKWYRFSHALAGAAVLACGFAMAVGL